MRLARFKPLVLFATFYGLWSSLISEATEVDQFSYRDIPLADSGELLDEFVQEAISTAVVEANRILERRGKTCQTEREEALRTVPHWGLVHDQVFSRVVGSWYDPRKMTGDASFRFLGGLGFPYTYEVSEQTVPSIYSQIGGRYWPMVTVTQTLNFGIEGEFLVHGQRIGADKITHFFRLGRHYYEDLFSMTPSGRLEVDCSGVRRLSHEEGIQGCSTGGFVFTYADIAANFDGGWFWSQLSSPDDPQSYVVCDESGQYQVNPRRAFSFREYVSPLYDEAVNLSVPCDFFLNPVATLSVLDLATESCGVPWPEEIRVADMNGQTLSSTEYCSELSHENVPTRLRSCLDQLVSPLCASQLSD